MYQSGSHSKARISNSILRKVNFVVESGDERVKLNIIVNNACTIYNTMYLHLDVDYHSHSFPNYLGHQDGCSVPDGLPRPFIELFTPECDKHDLCYDCVSYTK